MSIEKTFHQLGLSTAILDTLTELGYESPTPVQVESIPILIEGSDLLALAQTGTGKTAAFALPILSSLNLSSKNVQALVMTPTRELAIQVAEAFQSYAKQLKNFQIASLYGGQEYRTQLRALKRGAQIVVGTPGRLMDHLRRGSLSFDSLNTIVLDEADEMLKMGFIGDIEWILDQAPDPYQVALFSATMPSSIRNITKRYLKQSKKVHIKAKTNTVDSVKQLYLNVNNDRKLEVLANFLDIENVQASIIFTRTKNSSEQLAKKLKARGYAAAPLNGDMSQALRRKVIDQIRKKQIDMIVATDVAARGIDIDHISHVINFDIPVDGESYIHRVGRTGRAGRSGTALSFVTPRERRLLRSIERTIGHAIRLVDEPSIKEVNEVRVQRLVADINHIIQKKKKLLPCLETVEKIAEENNYRYQDVAAALLYLSDKNSIVTTDKIDDSHVVNDGSHQYKLKNQHNSKGGKKDRARSRKKSSSRSSKPKKKKASTRKNRGYR